MLAEASNHMDLISEHFYVQHKPGLLGHVNQAPAEIRRIAEAHRNYRADHPDAQDEGGPGRPRRVELLVRAPRLRRARDAVLPRGRARHRRRAQRIRPPERRLLHGQLRPDGQRHRGHQDVEDGGRARHDGRHPGALPQAFRDDSRRGRRSARAARRHGLLEGRGEERPDARDRQSDEKGGDPQARRGDDRAAEDSAALPRRRRRSAGLQRTGEGPAGRCPRNARRALRQKADRPPHQRQSL
ncbi:MAG: hypothetical protein MZV63_65310 [Marinilabiliales bacterium]|nr:hypothetical protein [Marinilabiliales bacterium]